ncbi:MAG: hypothetical protein AUH30_04140 [Candidatus Rokubacteria bacterium 13_1_40CM_68_15]|nr:MAG: hypothetical protein AUH30_04140 [Candidatus Rokubacteria bacterium 13_1_40CM_68_15]
MRFPRTCLLVTGILVLAACATETERQWMKLDQTYTTAEFRRDVAACTKSGNVDDECMKSRGWVAVTPPATKKPVDEPYRPGQQRPRM